MMIGGNVHRELENLDKDIARINDELKKEKENLHQISTIYKKLQDKDIPLMDPGTAREDAINNTKIKVIMVLKKINTMKYYLNLFTKSRNNLANSVMAQDIVEQVGLLNERVSRYTTVDTSTLETDLDNIADMNDLMDSNQVTINDSLSSVAAQANGSDEMLFRRFMEYESEDIAMLRKDDMLLHKSEKNAIDSLSFQ